MLRLRSCFSGLFLCIVLIKSSYQLSGNLNYVFMNAKIGDEELRQHATDDQQSDFCANVDTSEFSLANAVETAKPHTFLILDLVSPPPLPRLLLQPGPEVSLCSKKRPDWYHKNWTNTIIASAKCNELGVPSYDDTELSVIAGRLNGTGVMLVRELLYASYAPWINTSLASRPVFAIKPDVYKQIKTKIQSTGRNLTVRFYRPLPPKFDGSFVVIFLLSVFCVAVGGLWAGYTKKYIYERLVTKDASTVEQGNADNSAAKDESNKAASRASNAPSTSNSEPPHQPFNFCSLVMFVVVIISMLMLLYFFPKVMVWFVIVVFTIASSFALFSCIAFLLGKVPYCRCRMAVSFAEGFEAVFRRPFCAPCCRERFELRMILLYLACASVSICWCIFRHEAYEYILRDILGVCFCINLINSIRLPNLKWLTILLFCVLLYDVFFVFITPLFMKNQCSIMVDVASNGACSAGGGPKVGPSGPPDKTHEEIPVVFKVPRMGDPIFRCFDLSVDLEYPPALLGFGDVILPGLLISFCSGFDRLWNVKYHAYLVLTVVGYGVGMIVTFVALVAMEVGQPALIYLVPFTLIPTHLLALCKGHWRLMWSGDFPHDLKTAAVTPSDPVLGGNPAEQNGSINRAEPDGNLAVPGDGDNLSVVVASVPNLGERTQLIAPLSSNRNAVAHNDSV